MQYLLIVNNTWYISQDNFFFFFFLIWQYNTKDSSVKLAYEAQPRPKALASLSQETIVKVACGTNHTG